MGGSPSSFRIADCTLVRCDEGALDAEVTLFAAPIAARATTSAGEARARLARSGLTAALASEAVAAIDPEALATYAASDCVRSVVSTLGPAEVFAGSRFHRGTRTYDGAFFDLAALAADLRLKNAGVILQGLFLVSLLEPLSTDTPVSLENGGGGEESRLAFLKPRAVIEGLAQLGPRTVRAAATDDDREDALRLDLERLVRDRAALKTTARERARLRAIDTALAALDKPKSGPLSTGELWAVEHQLKANDLRGALERIQAYVRSHGGETSATRYLRAHLALLEGSEPPRRIAEDLLDERRAGAPFHELELLKARAWMAAGGWTYARHFARSLMNDPNAPDSVSLGAYEIYEASNLRAASSSAPPSSPSALSSVPPSPRLTPAPILMVAEKVVEPEPSSLDLPIDVEEPVSSRPAEERNAQYESDGNASHFAPPVFASPLPREPRIPIDRGHLTEPPPPLRPSAPPPVASAAPATRYVPEDVETLSLPDGLTDQQLAEGIAARNGNEVRIVSTRFSRLLAREYRETYGVRLRTDVQAIEWMQRHLVSRWGETGLAGPEAAWDVRRHGALLSEILARTLGARWVDVAPSEIGYWAMFVPPRTRTWPFGRAYRFLTLGHREKDLVSYYLDLVARTRQP